MRMRPYAGVEYSLTLCPLQSRLQHIYHGQPYAKVDLTLCQCRLYPPVRDFGIGLRNFGEQNRESAITVDNYRANAASSSELLKLLFWHEISLKLQMLPASSQVLFYMLQQRILLSLNVVDTIYSTIHTYTNIKFMSQTFIWSRGGGESSIFYGQIKLL